MKIIQLFSLIILLNGCQTSKLNLGVAKDFLPNNKHLQEGIVNKYYLHHKKHDSPDIDTHIVYESYQIKNDNLLHQRFNPDYRLTVSREFSYQQNQTILLNETYYSKKDTFPAKISKPIQKDWVAQRTRSENTIQYNEGWEYETITQQERNVDTIFLNRNSKLFEGEIFTIGSNGIDTNKRNYRFKKIYTQNLGLSYAEDVDSVQIHWMELVEQIPMKMFNRLARHNLQRVGYINPNEAIDKDSDFEICTEDDYINDYYNGGAVPIYKGGKKAIWNIVNQQLNTENLSNESGYLTFRFVVNCKGEMGRIITEEADLNFKNKIFNEATTTNFYNILKEMKDWIPVKIKDNNVNAYFYLTFKLKDGELIELLP